MSDWVWVLPLIVLIVGMVWSIWNNQRVVAELATRPDKESQVAGIDRVRTLRSQSLWGLGTWPMRTIRRHLDRDAARIASFEQEQRERDRAPWHP